jgi:hypothetical protein
MTHAIGDIPAEHHPGFLLGFQGPIQHEAKSPIDYLTPVKVRGVPSSLPAPTLCRAGRNAWLRGVGLRCQGWGSASRWPPQPGACRLVEAGAICRTTVNSHILASLPSAASELDLSPPA